jgi:hypothetical protein
MGTMSMRGELLRKPEICLEKALDEGKLQDIKGIGNQTIEMMRRYVSEHESRD